MENLARNIIRASFSQECMQYLDQEEKIVYAAKACFGRRSGDGESVNVSHVLECLAAMCSHIPNRGGQMVHCYGRSTGNYFKSYESDALVKDSYLVSHKLTLNF